MLSYYSDMVEQIPEIVRRPYEPIPETAKRLLGASLILMSSLPTPNKQGWTVAFALRMSDTIGSYGREYMDKLATWAGTTNQSPVDEAKDKHYF